MCIEIDKTIVSLTLLTLTLLPGYVYDGWFWWDRGTPAAAWRGRISKELALHISGSTYILIPAMAMLWAVVWPMIDMVVNNCWAGQPHRFDVSTALYFTHASEIPMKSLPLPKSRNNPAPWSAAAGCRLRGGTSSHINRVLRIFQQGRTNFS